MDVYEMILLSLLALFYCAKGDLNYRLAYYETLHHRDLNIFESVHHHISRRSPDKIASPVKKLEFTTLGRNFKLHLYPRRGLFSSHFKAVTVNSRHQRTIRHVDKHAFLEGYIEGEESNSTVNAYFEDKNLVASIATSEDTYVIEPSGHHLPQSENHTMLTYRASDMKKQWNKKKNHGSFCGFVHADQDAAAYKSPINSNDVPFISDGSVAPEKQTRYKRSNHNDDKTTCQVMLVADYHFYQTVGNSDFAKTANYLIAEMARVDSIYRNQDFGEYTGLGFEIAEIKVWDQPTPVSSGSKHYNMEATQWVVEDLLKEFSKEEDLSRYCLGHLWTSVAFSDGVLGLGWIADNKQNSAGGICSASSKGYSYNTAWTTALNKYGERVLTQEMDIVTAHEFGHNWGSQHDPSTDECSPSSFNGGKFTMYTYSVAGYEENNKKFSPCSQRSISDVLDVKKSSCFKVKSESFCGNLRVEAGYEECDAGANGDACCDQKCKLRSTAQCSDTNSVCCKNCQFASAATICLQAISDNTTCAADTYCNGASADCPAAANRPDGAACIDSGRCKDGDCLAFCESMGMISCRCETVVDSCKYCCKSKADAACQPYDSSNPTYLPKGKTCVQGTCNENGVCEKQLIGFSGRFFSIIENLSVDYIIEWMRSNIVIATIFISLVFYLPICIIICIVDYRRDKKDKEEISWHKKDNENLYLEKDKGRIRQGYTRDTNARRELGKSETRPRSSGNRNAVAPM